MKLKIGVDSFIWTEDFKEKDLWIISKAEELGFDSIDFAISNPDTFPTDKVIKELNKTNLEVAVTTTLNNKNNLISSDKNVRENGVNHLKKLINICSSIDSNVLGGVNYAGWGYLTGKPRTDEEWNNSVIEMKKVAEYAKTNHPSLKICVEPVNRFETHFINTASDGLKYCHDVGYDNMFVHLDCFHMIREEASFREAILECGKDRLGYVHLCENNRGIPGTGMVPYKEIFRALEEIDYEGLCAIESFDPSFEELNSNCAIWRKFADTGEDLAIQGLKNLRKILKEI